MLGACFLGSAAPVDAQHPDHHHHHRSARSALLRSMTHGRRIMVVAVVVHRPPHDPDREIELKLEQDGAGRVRFTTISPRQFEGMMSLDDGVEWTTYFPNDRRAEKQRSPRVEQGNPAYQLDLAVQNYKLTSEPGPPIAECHVECVVATPNSRELNQRRYYLEEHTSFMLREETIAPDGSRSVQLDTRSIAFLKTPPDLDLALPADVRVQSRHAPQSVSPPSEARPIVGFYPRIPDTLPMGFIVKDTQIVGGGDDKFVAVRITDGLANATVYEWDAHKRWHRQPRFMGSGFREAQGVRMSLVGDTPHKAGEIILDSFCK
jgi:hypothetical protein